MELPKEFWIVLDPMDGPHVFRTRKEAMKTLKRWEKEAEEYAFVDSYWDMTGPLRYILAPKQKMHITGE